MLNPFKKGTSLLEQAVPIAQLLSQLQGLMGGLDGIKGQQPHGKVVEEKEEDDGEAEDEQEEENDDEAEEGGEDRK